MIDMQAAAKSYVRFVLGEKKLSPSGLAKIAGLSSTTLTRALNDPHHKYSLSMTTLQSIAEATGINPAPFLQAENFGAMSMVPYTDDINSGWNKNANKLPIPEEGDLSIVIGDVAVGVWKEHRIAGLTNFEAIYLGVSGLPGDQHYAVRVIDNSVNKTVRKDEYVVCVNWHWDAVHGDLVLIERWKEGVGLMELSLRRLIEDGLNQPYLRLESDDPRFSEIIELDRDWRRSSTIKVVGIGLYAVRRLDDPTVTNDVRRSKRRLPPFGL